MPLGGRHSAQPLAELMELLVAVPGDVRRWASVLDDVPDSMKSLVKNNGVAVVVCIVLAVAEQITILVTNSIGIDGVRAWIPWLVQQHDHGPDLVADHRQHCPVLALQPRFQRPVANALPDQIHGLLTGQLRRVTGQVPALSHDMACYPSPKPTLWQQL
jgi:hypothetical protein